MMLSKRVAARAVLAVAPSTLLRPFSAAASAASAGSSGSAAAAASAASPSGASGNRVDRNLSQYRSASQTATFQARMRILNQDEETAAADIAPAPAAAAAADAAAAPASPIESDGVGLSGRTTLETIPGQLVYSGQSSIPIAPVSAALFRSKSARGVAPASRRNIPISPQKLNDICRMVRGVNVQEAIIQLKLSQKKKAYYVAQLIAMAAAHAVNTHNMERSRLYVDKLWVGQGLHLKRLDIKARGRCAIKRKYRSHLYVEVREQGADPAQYKGVWKFGGRSHDPRTGEEIRIGRVGRKISTIQRTLEHMQQWRTQRGMSPKPQYQTTKVDARRAFRSFGIATDLDAVFGAQDNPVRLHIEQKEDEDEEISEEQ